MSGLDTHPFKPQPQTGLLNIAQHRLNYYLIPRPLLPSHGLTHSNCTHYHVSVAPARSSIVVVVTTMFDCAVENIE